MQTPKYIIITIAMLVLLMGWGLSQSRTMAQGPEPGAPGPVQGENSGPAPAATNRAAWRRPR